MDGADGGDDARLIGRHRGLRAANSAFVGLAPVGVASTTIAVAPLIVTSSIHPSTPRRLHQSLIIKRDDRGVGFVATASLKENDWKGGIRCLSWSLIKYFALALGCRDLQTGRYRYRCMPWSSLEG